MKIHHITDLKSYSSEQIEDIIKLSIKIKKNPKTYSKSLTNKKLYMLFQKTSTRTALAFGLAMNELGGIYFIQKFEDSNFTVGEIEDEVRYVCRNVDVILARLKLNKDIEKMEKFSSVPIINGCCNKFHPSQALADMLTIYELFGTFKISLIYIGIWNNVLNSLILTLPKLGGNLSIFTPIVHKDAYDQDVMDFANKNSNVNIIKTENMNREHIKNLISKTDIVYVDTWVDMEFFFDKDFKKEKEKRIKKMIPFQLSKDLIKGTNVKVMHDMPMHPGYEISREVIEEHIDTILQQAENRRHSAKGILLSVLRS